MDFTFAEQEAVSCTVSCKGGRMQGANPCPQFLKRGERMTNQEWLAEQIKKLPPEEVYDMLYNIVINIGRRYNTSRSGVADWLMRDAILEEVEK